MKNPSVQKIMDRYYSKYKEFESKSEEELNELIKLGIENELKMSSTDKQALQDVYKKIIHMKMENKIKELQEKRKNDANQGTEQNNNVQRSGKTEESINKSTEQ